VGEAGDDGDDHGRPLHRPAAADDDDRAAADDGHHPARHDRHHPDDRDAMTRRRRVAVLMGGRSSEHPISVASAQSVIAALDPERYEVVAIEIARDGHWSLPSGQDRRALAPGSEPGTQLPVPGTSNEIAATLGDVEVVLPIL